MKAATAYFAIVFGAGFVLGALRVTLVVPRIGVRAAELLETPLMFVVVVFAARTVVRRFALVSAAVRLGAGLVALAMMIAAELLLAVALEGRSITQYIASRDPVSGSVYLAMLMVFALMPWLLAQSGTRR